MTTAYEMMENWAMEADGTSERLVSDQIIEADARCPYVRPIAGRQNHYYAIGGDCIFIEDLVLDASIGIYADELTTPQPVRVTLCLETAPLPAGVAESSAKMVCYDHIAKGIEAIISEGHIDLVETLAERIAEFCLALPRGARVCVTVSKPEAVKNAATAGVKITRSNVAIRACREKVATGFSQKDTRTQQSRARP